MARTQEHLAPVALVASKDVGFTDLDRTRPQCGQHTVDVLGSST